jgi:alpha-glucosidase
VRKWWGNWYKRLLDVGFDGFWNDMNEPTIFGHATFPPLVQHDLEGRGAAPWQVHSAYGMQMARATFEGLNALRPNLRNWVFTRSAYAGAQRYASSWTADNRSAWGDLQITPAMLMNLGLSGLAFTGSDVGGFEGAPSSELFARWISMAAFNPFFRTHTTKDSPWQEPWRYGEEVEAVSRKYIELRYQLLPYVYTIFWQHATQGMPMMRPMFFEDPADEAFLVIDDQWLFGDHLLAAPALEAGMVARDVLLPAGEWYDFWTDERLAGGQTVSRETPLDMVPLFVRAGAALPMIEVQQFTGEKPHASPTVHLYPGSGLSWWYEDDGETLDYRRGAYRLTRFEMREEADGIILERSVQGDFRPGYQNISIILHGPEIASAFLDEAPLIVLNNQVQINADDWSRLKVTIH